MGVFLVALWLAPSAFAGPPVHQPLSGESVEGLDHACGAAVDSNGYVYAASAGEGKVKVFDVAHVEVKSITNTDEPCGLAVDSQGNLYVSERTTGEVVRYHPNAYPPTASTTYTETTIDASGNAKGIAVDPFDDSLFVAEGSLIAMFNSQGTPGIDEQQRVQPFGATGGSYRLSFDGQETAPIPYEAEHADVQSALEALSTVGSGNVSVTQAGGSASKLNHLITFKGALAGTNVELVSCNTAELTGASPGCFVTTITQGFDGHIGEGELDGATGVAAYTYGGSRRYLSIAEPGDGEVEVLVGTDLRAMELRHTIDGSETPDGELGLEGEAYLGVDSRNGHVFAYDATHQFVNEFEATGRYFARIAPEPPSALLEGGSPTAIAVDRSGAAGDGTVYVSTGAGSGAALLAFEAVPPPDRRALPTLSHEFAKACGTAVDSEGDLFVAGTTKISIYDFAGSEIGSIDEPQHPCGLAVDSEGNLYAVLERSSVVSGDEEVVVYEPTVSYPFAGSATYGAPKTIEPGTAHRFPRAVAVDPADGRLFISHTEGQGVDVYEALEGGGGLIEGSFCGLGGQLAGIDVYGKSGEVYVVNEGTGVLICSGDGSEVLNRIDGSGSPKGAFGGLPFVQIAVDQSNDHVVVGTMGARGAVEEYEASGAFVGSFGSFTKSLTPSDVALDNSGGPNDGDLYVAYDDPANATDLSAFGPLDYGAPPIASTGLATAVSPTGAILNGTVDPSEFAPEECAFEWGEAGQPYEHRDACEETPAQIGEGDDPVPVHLDLTGIEPETVHYHFRLVAKNKYGEDRGEEGLFGPPILTEKIARPILYREATLRGEVDPFGLETEYRFEYGTTEAYGQSTPVESLPAGEHGPVDVEAFLTGLAEGTTYHFRLIAENDAAAVVGPDQELTTLEREGAPNPACANETRRLENNSGRLTECRAYELVTPADTRNVPHAEEFAVFNNWLVTPSGPMAGSSLAFFLLNATLPGVEGNGLREGFRAIRTAEGAGEGWHSAFFAPSNAQKGTESGVPTYRGLSSDQLYSFWRIRDLGPPGTLAPGNHLRTPVGFEAVGKGSLGDDLDADPAYVAAGGTHVIFASAAHLEDAAAPAGTAAIYDREAGSSQAKVVSLRPDGSSFGGGEAATYLGAAPDGSSVAFSAAGHLYLRLAGAVTVEVAASPFSFAGVSEDGGRVFYTDSASPKDAAGLWVCDVDADDCSTSQIATNAKISIISADGSRVYFTKGGDLYLWDGGSTKQIAPLDPGDFAGAVTAPFPGTSSSSEEVGLDAWTSQCVGLLGAGEGAANCPLRTTPDGHFFVFQSHADLTPPFEGQGHSQIYRYDALTEALLCVSCDPSGVPASADADLQAFKWPDPSSTIMATTLIPGITDDGGEIFFQTAAALLPEDANSVLDVYEWRAPGTAGCQRAKGCLSLVSSGQGENASTIYSMTPDGHDVFFSTLEKLIPSDIAGSPSIYDARVGGGFPQPTLTEPCHGDACQPPPDPTPARSLITTGVSSAGNEPPARRRRCGKGRHAVKRQGRIRCVRNGKARHRHKRAAAKRRAGR